VSEILRTPCRQYNSLVCWCMEVMRVCVCGWKLKKVKRYLIRDVKRGEEVKDDKGCE